MTKEQTEKVKEIIKKKFKLKQSKDDGLQWKPNKQRSLTCTFMKREKKSTYHHYIFGHLWMSCAASGRR